MVFVAVITMMIVIFAGRVPMTRLFIYTVVAVTSTKLHAWRADEPSFFTDAEDTIAIHYR